MKSNEIHTTTVLLCVYNGENTVAEAIESVLNQSYQLFDLLIINDGSIDSTPQIIADYSNKYENINIINKSNSGVGDSKNIGIQEIKTEWVAFIDADDVWLENKLELQLETAKLHHDAEVIVTDMISYDKKSPASPKTALTIEPLVNIFSTLVLRNFPFQPATAMVKTKLFHTKAQFKKDRSGEDYYPYLKFSFARVKFYQIKLPLYRERSLDGSLQRSPNSTYECGISRVRAIDSLLAEEKCNQEELNLLHKAKDNYLGWAIAGVRSNTPYPLCVKSCLALICKLSSKKKIIIEVLKTLLFPLIRKIKG